MTGTDLEQRIVVNPVTGEMVDLALGTDTIARARREVVDAKDQLDVFATDLDTELNARLDAANLRSAIVDDGSGECRWEITGKAAFTEEYPVVQLQEALDLLIDVEKLTPAVKDAVLVEQPRPAPKVNKRELNKLLKHMDPEVRDLIASCKIEKPQKRTVGVKQLPPPAIPARAAA